jgi:hypothetical protein
MRRRAEDPALPFFIATPPLQLEDLYFSDFRRVVQHNVTSIQPSTTVALSAPWTCILFVCGQEVVLNGRMAETDGRQPVTRAIARQGSRCAVMKSGQPLMKRNRKIAEDSDSLEKLVDRTMRDDCRVALRNRPCCSAGRACCGKSPCSFRPLVSLLLRVPKVGRGWSMNQSRVLQMEVGVGRGRLAP